MFPALLVLFLFTAATHPTPPLALWQPDARIRPEPLARLRGQPQECFNVRFSPDNTRLATVPLWGGAVNVWDAITGKKLRTVRFPDSPVAAFSANWKRLAAGSFRNGLKVWEVATGRELLSLEGHPHHLYELAFTPCGAFLATLGSYFSVRGEYEGEVRVWDLQTGKQKYLFRGKDVGLRSIAYSPGGKLIATGQMDGLIRIRELGTGRAALVLRGHEERVERLAFGPCGRRLVSVDDGGEGRVWDLRSGKQILVLRRPEGRVAQAVFSPDGKRLIGVGVCGPRYGEWEWVDGVWVWDVATGRGRLAHLGSRRGTKLYSMTMSPDGSRLATGHGDGTVKVWSVEQVTGR
jgi:WD40 repeat protein